MPEDEELFDNMVMYSYNNIISLFFVCLTHMMHQHGNLVLGDSSYTLLNLIYRQYQQN